MKANHYTAEQIIKLLEQAERASKLLVLYPKNTALLKRPSTAGARRMVE